MPWGHSLINKTQTVLSFLSTIKFNVLHQCFHFIYLSENCWTKHTYTQKNTILKRIENAKVPEFLSEYQRNRRSVFQASGETRRTPPRCRRVFAWSATAEERAGVEYRYRILGGESRGRLELRARSTCRCSGSPPPQPEGARSPTGFPAARKCLAACSLSGSPSAPAAPP